MDGQGQKLLAPRGLSQVFRPALGLLVLCTGWLLASAAYADQSRDTPLATPAGVQNEPAIEGKSENPKSPEPGTKALQQTTGSLLPQWDDADLHGLYFVDHLRGWVVGDRGVIRHTTDGGQTWQLQASQVYGRLQTVYFTTPEIGWIAGQQSEPHGQGSTGILLRTMDGGKTWEHTPTEIPGVQRIYFESMTKGWAIGAASAGFPGGVYVTTDGGKTWLPNSSKIFQDWNCGDILPSGQGLLGGNAKLGLVLQSAVSELSTDIPLGIRKVRGIRYVNEQVAWLVGDGGLILQSTSQGHRWHVPAGKLPEGAQQFDFAALEVQGPRFWAAGSPGTGVFFSEDGGQSWLIAPTGQNLPIHAVQFADELHGWCVGAQGTILASRNGGKTWSTCFSGGTRTSLLAIVPDELDVPLEVFAATGAADGFLGRAEVVARRDVEIPGQMRHRLSARLHDAVVAAGGTGSRTSSWFPARQAGLPLSEQHVLQSWNWVHQGRVGQASEALGAERQEAGLQQLESHLVRQIRLWRPSVIVTRDAATSRDPVLAELVYQATLRAVAAAARPEMFPEHRTQAGLQPWQIERVWVATDSPSTQETVTIRSQEMVPVLGANLSEIYQPAQFLISSTAQPVETSTLVYRRKFDRDPARLANDFFAGIDYQPSSNSFPGIDGRREQAPITPDLLEKMQRDGQSQHNVAAILELAASGKSDWQQVIGQINYLLRDYERTWAAMLLFQAAGRSQHAGDWQMASQLYELIAKEYADHELALPAMVWLVHYYGSRELAHMTRGENVLEHASMQTAGLEASQAQAELAQQQLQLQIQEQQRIGQHHVRRATLAAGWGGQVAARRPEWMREPFLGFPLGAAGRSLGMADSGQRFYSMLRRVYPPSLWWQTAVAEIEMQSGQFQVEPAHGKPVLAMQRVEKKPYLDGILDDACWQQATAAELKSRQGDDHGWPAMVKLAYDQEYLYVAIQCRQAPGIAYPLRDDSQPRPRDALLQQNDRIELYLDIDRDYKTYYKLVVDHRGQSAESCWHNPRWNPNWFIASATVQDWWTAEIAIPLAELTTDPLLPQQPWAIGIQRVVPGVGFQSWQQPAAVEVMPESFGLLVAE